MRPSNTSVAGVAYRNGAVLLMHRLPGGSVGGLWEFPGGKCEPDESPEDALKREWLEETGLEITVGAELARGSFSHKGEDFSLIAFEVILPPGNPEPALREHDDWSWVRPAELGVLDLVASDRVVAEAVGARYG